MRPVPESGYCLVYAPSIPELLSVNTTAWLVLELSTGRDFDEITAAFHHEVAPLLTVFEAREQVAAALDDLVTRQLVVVGD
jgi:hypothetical protein